MPSRAQIQIDAQAPPPPPSPVTRIEAETATICSGGTVDSNHLGFTDTGFVNPPDVVGSDVEWSVSGLSAGGHAVTFRYSNGTTAPGR